MCIRKSFARNRCHKQETTDGPPVIGDRKLRPSEKQHRRDSGRDSRRCIMATLRTAKLRRTAIRSVRKDAGTSLTQWCRKKKNSYRETKVVDKDSQTLRKRKSFKACQRSKKRVEEKASFPSRNHRPCAAKTRNARLMLFLLVSPRSRRVMLY